MREFLLKLFGTTSGSVEITWLSVWHFIYLIAIVGGVIATIILLNKKASEKTKTTYVRVLAYVVPGIYIFNLFIMAFLGNMGAFVDKLPFHICTLLAIFVPFAQFNKKFACIKDTIAALAIVSAMMYIVYPGSALGGVMPWCYKVVETFAYHGALFAWGCITVGTKQTNLDFKNIWKVFVGIGLIVCWAFIGTSIYSSETNHYDWFFVTGTTYPFIPKWLMPFVVVVAVFGVAACVFLIDFVAKKIEAKHLASKGQAVFVSQTQGQTAEKKDVSTKKEEDGGEKQENKELSAKTEKKPIEPVEKE